MGQTRSLERNARSLYLASERYCISSHIIQALQKDSCVRTILVSILDDDSELPGLEQLQIIIVQLTQLNVHIRVSCAKCALRNLLIQKNYFVAHGPFSHRSRTNVHICTCLS